ncbi:MAG: hypothetical protein HDQ91_04270 [Desulfovibrio sp.]|nr:hypothetical protein [Desulfovibrio sp.]
MPVLIRAEVGGIQKFIFATGKLKEMIGGSEIVYQICHKDFYEPVLGQIGCGRKADAEMAGNDWHILLQNNAGILALLLPDERLGFAFLQAYSKKVLEQFPGLPIFGAQAPVAWDTASYREARSIVEQRINLQRRSAPPGAGAPMLPVLRASRLDGLPAVAEERSGESREFISLPSLCRRQPGLLKRAEERLRAYADISEKVIWTGDMEAMLPEGGKIALIHMDGNSMGKLFSDTLEEAEQLPVAQGVAALQTLSGAIENINREAFRFAVNALLAYIRQFDKSAVKQDALVMPLRPLVIGGDDITLVIRADLALFFVDLFVSQYERLAASKGYALSLGVGMAVMDSSWPFAKAFALVEELTRNAKKLTAAAGPIRPSSLDYLVITEEVDKNVADLRRRVYTAADGMLLTGKPFELGAGFLLSFMEEGREILETLPRSALRPAFAACRNGANIARAHWLNTRENLERGLGGRKGRLMRASRFERLFPENYFRKDSGATMLGDYLELSRLLPPDPLARNGMLKIMREGGNANV